MPVVHREPASGPLECVPDDYFDRAFEMDRRT
jgi:hypothetical protein